MSNRSSHIKFKSTVADAVQANQKIESLESLNREPVTDQPRPRGRVAFNILQDNKIRIFSPFSISSPSQLPFREVWTQLGDLWAKQNQNYEFVRVYRDKMPLGQGYRKITPDSVLIYEENTERYMPSYFPRYFNVPPDTTLYKQVFHHFNLKLGLKPDGTEGVPEDGYDLAEEAKYIFGDVDSLKHFGENYCFTTGTLYGQITRLKDNHNVNKGVTPYHKVKSLREQKLTFDDVGKILERFLPLPGYRDSGEEIDYPLSGNYSNYVSAQKLGDEEYLVQNVTEYFGDTKAGMPFRQSALKREALWDSLTMANLFLYDLTVALESQNIKNIKKLMRQWWFLSVGYLFPKGERYKLVHRTHTVSNFEQTKPGQYKEIKTQESRFEAEKTRNIWSMPFVTHILASQNKIRLKEFNPINIDNSDTPSLYKWSPWKGGMDRLVTKLKNKILEFKESKKTFDSYSLIYADNWYLLQMSRSGDVIETTWFSIDQTKGESNATRSHMAAFENYVLQTCYTKKTKDIYSIYYNSTWGYFYRNILPSITVNTTGLFCNMLVDVPGQGSGNTNTFFTNHTMSAIVVDTYEKKFKGIPMSQELLDKLAEITGVDWKIEYQSTNDFLKEIDSVKASPKDYDSKLIGKVLRLEMLGYDAVYLKETGSFVPVLDKSRLLKSTILPKNFNSQGNNIALSLYTTIRYNSLLMSGAWNYPILKNTLEAMIKYEYNKISKLIHLLTDESIDAVKAAVELPFDMTELEDPEVSKYISGFASSVPKEAMLKLFQGDPLKPPVSGKYHPLRSSVAKKDTLLVVPGMNTYVPFRKDHVTKTQNSDINFNKIVERWVDELDDEEEKQEDQFGKMQKKEGAGMYTKTQRSVYLTSTAIGPHNVAKLGKRKGVMLSYVLANDSNILCQNAEIYLTVDFSEKWADYKTKLKGASVVNPAGEGVFFDPETSKILTDRNNKFNYLAPEVRLEEVSRSQKKNLKKKYESLDQYKQVTPLRKDQVKSMYRKQLVAEMLDIVNNMNILAKESEEKDLSMVKKTKLNRLKIAAMDTYKAYLNYQDKVDKRNIVSEEMKEVGFTNELLENLTKERMKNIIVDQQLPQDPEDENLPDPEP